MNITCTPPAALVQQPIFTRVYTFGDAVTVDGTVAGIVPATKFDSRLANRPIDQFGIVAAKDNLLFLGDASGQLDVLTDIRRPVQLNLTSKFTKQ